MVKRQRHETNNDTKEGEDIHPFLVSLPGLRLFFCWLLPLLRYGFRNTLEMENMYPVVSEDSAEVLVKQLERSWEKELEDWKLTGKEPSLLRALLRILRVHLILTGIPLFFLYCVFHVLGAVFLASFIQFFDDDGLSEDSDIFVFAAAITVNRLLIATFLQPTFFWNNRIALRSRVALSGLMFKKILRLSQEALRESSTGQIINMLSTDVHSLDMAFMLLHFIWVVPVMLLICSIILWYILGPPSLLCPAVVLIMIPCLILIGGVNSKLRSEKCILTDARVRIMNEIITAVQLIKVHAWEKPFTDLLLEARKLEVSKLKQICFIRAIETSLPITSSQVILFAMFSVFTASGHLLTSSVVFIALPISVALMKEVALHFLGACTRFGELLVVIRRIQNFLILEELGDDLCSRSAVGSKALSDIPGDTTIPGQESNEEMAPLLHQDKPEVPQTQTEDIPGIQVVSLSGQWALQGEGQAFTLSDVTFTVEPGEVMAVIGPVGSGKSMLLLALLGELPNCTGSVKISKHVGFSDQQPWVFSGSIQENILFGRKLDKTRYNEVLEWCDLSQDLLQFPNSDQTLVGEKGVKLSGGQRSRVSLARTLYSDAAVYLLDDPLSAVDSKVGRHIFEKCIQKAMKNKAVLLVTHQLQYLRAVDRILVLKDGTVSGYGTYQELEKSGVDFGSLLSKGEAESENDLEEELTRSSCDHVSLSKSEKQNEEERPNHHKMVVAEETKLEKKKIGIITGAVYKKYLLAGSSLLFLSFVVLLCVFSESFRILSDWWLASWTVTEEDCVRSYSEEICLQNATLYNTQFPVPRMGRSYFTLIYAVFVFCMVLFTFLSSALILHVLIQASSNLHNKMFEAILRCPQQFFVINPVGRILNRFTKDIGFMDDRLIYLFANVNFFLTHTLAVFIFISITNPFVLIFLVPMVIICWIIRKFFLASSRDVKRLESLANSPVYSYLSMTLSGLTTVRAFKGQEFMYSQYCSHQDLHTTTYFLHISLERWLSICMEGLQIVLGVVVVWGSIFIDNYFEIDGAKLGICLAYLVTMAGEFAYGVRLTADLENVMVATERVIEYTKLPPEAPLTSSIPLESDWPQKGEIILKGVSLRYSQEGPDALRNINVHIHPREKIGIVGRTGAGKSSLTVALLRLAEPAGTILIDGVDISEIGLHDLRKRISFIPQDPLLFEGTLRRNLDPFDEYTDDEIWSSLQEVQLQDKVQQEPNKLDMLVAEGGSNFSVGEKQLVCLARALLSQNQILVVDEATANVDYEN
ncbi:Multidrug resistance-associated protein 4 [Holothuria leucospilota]|uniref:Multidrug resistance-associated protein 4 n=1 Tax=Holothuria leucospilota TaxID=206669 RepID=A0A9Q1CBU5_HOLLE|nr:Multidrug resistance-associated protein 4 [Holothuria leucospilota]